MTQTPPAGGTPPGAKDEKSSALQPLFAIGTAVTTLAAILGTLVFSGLLARLPRNNWWLATIAFGLVIAAAALWTISSLFRSETKQPKPVAWLLVAGIVVFSVGLIAAVGGVFNTYSQDEKPRIKVRFDQATGLTAEIKVSGLGSNEEISVRVHGWRRDPADPNIWLPSQLYNAAVGPAGDGEVDHSVELPIAYGTYELLTVSAQTGKRAELEKTQGGTRPRCPVAAQEQTQTGAGGQNGPPPTDSEEPPPDELEEPPAVHQRTKTGCLMFTLPRFARVPELKAKLADDDKSVTLSLASENTPYRALLQVAARIEGGWKLLRRELVMPNAAGVIAAERDVDIPDSATRLCAMSTWYRSGEELPLLTCPSVTDNETVWTLIKLPAD